MTELPGYDEWKTHNPDDDRCEFCGAHDRECRAGWQPDRCTGECGRSWRDPDQERDQRIEDERNPIDVGDYPVLTISKGASHDEL